MAPGDMALEIDPRRVEREFSTRPWCARAASRRPAQLARLTWLVPFAALLRTRQQGTAREPALTKERRAVYAGDMKVR